MKNSMNLATLRKLNSQAIMQNASYMFKTKRAKNFVEALRTSWFFYKTAKEESSTGRILMQFTGTRMVEFTVKVSEKTGLALIQKSNSINQTSKVVSKTQRKLNSKATKETKELEPIQPIEFKEKPLEWLYERQNQWVKTAQYKHGISDVFANDVFQEFILYVSTAIVKPKNGEPYNPLERALSIEHYEAYLKSSFNFFSQKFAPGGESKRAKENFDDSYNVAVQGYEEGKKRKSRRLKFTECSQVEKFRKDNKISSVDIIAWSSMGNVDYSKDIEQIGESITICNRENSFDAVKTALALMKPTSRANCKNKIQKRAIMLVHKYNFSYIETAKFLSTKETVYTETNVKNFVNQGISKLVNTYIPMACKVHGYNGVYELREDLKLYGV